MKLRLLLMIFALIMFSSCENKKEKNNLNKQINNSLSGTNSEAKKDIELLKEYLAKKDKNLSDENGFPIRYSVENSWDKAKTISTSDTIGWVEGEDGYQYFLRLSVGLNKLDLILNGETQKTISVLGQVYGLNSLANNRHTSNTEFKEKEYIYFPELDNESVRTDIIKELTTEPQFNSMRDESPYLQEWNNELTRVIKESNIFKFKNSQDYDKEFN